MSSKVVKITESNSRVVLSPEIEKTLRELGFTEIREHKTRFEPAGRWFEAKAPHPYEEMFLFYRESETSWHSFSAAAPVFRSGENAWHSLAKPFRAENAWVVTSTVMMAPPAMVRRYRGLRECQAQCKQMLSRMGKS